MKMLKKQSNSLTIQNITIPLYQSLDVSKQVDVSDMIFDHSPSTTSPIARVSQ